MMMNEPSITIDDFIIREADVAGIVTLRLSAPSQKTDCFNLRN